jgi:hypothetical protein
VGPGLVVVAENGVVSIEPFLVTTGLDELNGCTSIESNIASSRSITINIHIRIVTIQFYPSQPTIACLVGRAGTAPNEVCVNS